MIAVDFHTHTYHSYDCLMMPEKILKCANLKGLNAIIINDHDTIKGGLECAKINKNKDLEIIVGAEIKTNIGDLTGIFLKEEINSRHYNDVITEIKNQGGITILNHPFVGHHLDDMNFSGIDLIEGINGRLSKQQNELAIELSKKLSIPIIAGSDSHTYSEIGNCKTFYNTPVNWLSPIEIEYKQCPVLAPIKSQFIKAYKKKDVGLFIQVLMGSSKKIINRFFNESKIY